MPNNLTMTEPHPNRPASVRYRTCDRVQGRVQPGGFTMIELLTVIAIIGIISGILVLGFKHVARDRQRDQTVALLKRLDNAMAELTSTSAGAHKMFTIQLPAIYYPEPVNNVFPESTYKNWTAVPAGALESVVRTAVVLDRIIATNPSAKAFLQALPPERRRKITFANTVPGAGALIVAPSTIPTSIMPLDAWGNPILFVFDGLQIATGTNVGRPFTVDFGGAKEFEVGGLTNLIVDSDKSYYRLPGLTPAPTYSMGGNTDMPNAAENAKPMGFDAMLPTGYSNHKNAVNPAIIDSALRSPDHRPFWVSAGPDGKYETNDDNVYSFGD